VNRDCLEGDTFELQGSALDRKWVIYRTTCKGFSASREIEASPVTTQTPG